jgi:carbamoyl-phosphate synthase large subunit
MVNCNPETVSTDYDTSDRLYFEPLTLEDVLGVMEVEKPEGVIVQFGGQTPLKLAAGLRDAGVPILGTSVESIDAAEDRGRFGALLAELGYEAPPWSVAPNAEEALRLAAGVGFPLLVRPSYVLGGRAMEIVYSLEGLADYLQRVRPAGDIYLDRFLENAVEVDVDALCDGTRVWVGGIMQHVEEAGVHSGDSACALPPHSLDPAIVREIRARTEGIAVALGVVGLINVQFAVAADERVFVIEANPRASRTVPFVSKAIGIPLAKMACRLMLGETLDELDLPLDPMRSGHVSVKEAVMPFNRFTGSDSLLGPEMRSTGEVMGIAADFPTAFAKAQAASGSPLPQRGTAFITVTDSDKQAGVMIAAMLHDLGFKVVATRGTARAIRSLAGVPVEGINKIAEGSPHVLDWIGAAGTDGTDAVGRIDLVINTPTGSGARSDGYEIRSAAVARGIPCITTLSGALAAVRAIQAARGGEPEVLALQSLHHDRAREAVRT